MSTPVTALQLSLEGPALDIGSPNSNKSFNDAPPLTYSYASVSAAAPAPSILPPLPPESSTHRGDRIIVGIDFGTTHSAVAWAHTSTPDEYEVITQWPGQSGKDWGKVPSDVAYDLPAKETAAANSPDPNRPNASSSSSPNSLGFKWGFEVPPASPQKISWIKILLDPSQPRPTFVCPKKITLPCGKRPVDIVADYLKALRSYTLLTLKRRLGANLIGRTPIDYVLTIPAVWSDKARQMTLEAAMAAGLGGNPEDKSTLRLITEPEGAAEYALRSIRPNSIKAGDCFTVCDCGGGTVDLITYSVASLSPLQLHEVAVGTGALCGAVYLDRRFEDKVSAWLGKDVYESMNHRARWQMGQHWETFVKREFNVREGDDGGGGGDEDGDFWVPVMGVPDSPDGRIRGGFLRVTRAEVKDIFEPIVEQVLELVSSQVLSVFRSSPSTPVSAMLLVGGFGSSEYLYRRIIEWSRGTIPIMQPRNAWTAVVRGAILRGLQGDVSTGGAVVTRRCRRYYGVVHDARFDPDKHEDTEKRWHDLRCEWVVRNRVQWYIKRGDITTDNVTLSFPFYRSLPIHPPPAVPETHYRLKTELWTSETDGPAPTSTKRDGADGVRKLCVMESEPVPVERFVKMRNEKGHQFWRVDYWLDMTVRGGVVVYEMRLSNAGKGREEQKVGRVEVVYE